MVATDADADAALSAVAAPSSPAQQSRQEPPRQEQPDGGGMAPNAGPLCSTAPPPTPGVKEAPAPEGSAAADACESSDDAGSSHDDSDWKTSSSSEASRPSLPSRFSLVALPGRVRASLFSRPPRRRKQQQQPTRRSAPSGSHSQSHAQSAAAALSLAPSPPPRRQSSLRSLAPFRRRRPTLELDTKERFKRQWDEKLRHAMERLAANLSTRPGTGGAGAGDDDDVFHLLLKLYAHQDVVEELYARYESSADAFEFYVPQLCTFLVHGNYAKQHQLECFVMSRSGDSLPFAHRLTWFLRSFCDDARAYQSEYLSVTAAPDQENADLLSAIELRAGVPALLMNHGLCVEEVSAARPADLQRRRSIVFPIDQELDADALASDESFAGHLRTKRQSVVYEARTDEGNLQQLSLYKQTPAFVDALTGLADRLQPVPRPQRNDELRKGLREIQDALLPSDVLYLPIGNSCHRVKAIHADECFAFSTKERVPYFLCVEVLDYAASEAEASTTKRKHKHARGFSLKLPFNMKSAEAAEAHGADGSPAVADCYVETEDESVVLLTPRVPRVTLAQIMEGEQLYASLPQGAAEDWSSTDGSGGHAVASSPAATYLSEPLDGEVGDDEKDEPDEQRRAGLFEDESAAEEEVRQQSTDEQLERMGQWSQPRTRRDSKTQTSSASARSGAQFDTFYSSWFSRKTRHEQPETTSVAHVPDLFMENEAVEQVTQVEAAEDGASVAAQVRSEAVAPSGDREGVDASTDTALAEPKEAGKPTPAAGSGAFMSWLPWRKAGGSSGAAHDEAVSVPPDAGEEGASVEEAVETTVEVFSASTIDLVDGYCGSPVVVSVKTVAPAPVDDEATGEVSEEAARTAESTGVFGWLFRKNKAPAAPTPDGSFPNDEVAIDGPKQQERDGGDTSSEHEEEERAAAGDAAERSTVRSDSDPVDGGQPVAEPASENPEMPDEPPDSTAADLETEAKPKGADDQPKAPAESVKSLFWFARRSKPATSSAACSTATQSTDVTDAGDEDAAIAMDEGAGEADAAESSQDEDKPRRRQRSRDLSRSLDFMDPEAWKQDFDLEDDGLSDAYLTEEDESVAVAAAAAAAAATSVSVAGMDEEEEDDEPDVPEHLERLEEDEKPMIVFRERWSDKEARLRQQSPLGDHPGWRLLSVIVKSNDDLRQEQFAAQLIAQCDRIFRQYQLPLKLRPYNVIATSATTGLIEAVPDTVSLDSLKRNDPEYTTLLDFYYRLHGPKDSLGFSRARRNFAESLAAYSIVCYVLQIKDRHNGNILLDTTGHVIHIDFGFLLTNSPGSNLNFERAPFKLTDEFVELLGGPRSAGFRYFRSLCIRAFLALRRDMDKLVLLVEMMLVGNADLPCFAGGKKAVVDGLRARLLPGARTSACQLAVNQLINQSLNNWRTRWYDKYQRACLGIR